jgi:predicted metal-dependent HD superfamily phosphohydrolase
MPHVETIEMALWWHDMVYNPRASDNEAQSAAVADVWLARGGWPSAVRANVRDLILATRHTALVSDPAAQWVVDIDLAILGSAPEAFDRYEAQVRQEYAWVPELVFRPGRIKILRSFRQRPRLYQTAYFFEHYEAMARANLSRSLARLNLKT